MLAVGHSVGGAQEGGEGIELMRAAPLARRAVAAGASAVAFAGRAPGARARRAAAMAGAETAAAAAAGAGTSASFPPLVGERARFGPYDIASTQVFHVTELSFAIVNLKPVVPGHVLVAPRRVEARFAALRADEVADLWATAQLVGKAVERHYGAEALTVRALPRESARPVRERRARVARAARRALRPHAGQWTVRVYPHADSERSC